MKKYFFILLCAILLACVEPNTNNTIPHIPNKYIAKSAENLEIKGDTLYYKKQKYSGFIYEMYPNQIDTFSVEGYFDGLLNGVSKKWHENKKLMEERYFVASSKNGKQLAFWENGKTKFQYLAKNDAYEGEMIEWAQNGNLYHIGNYVNGQEEGAQKMWHENGKIRANYVIRNGKRFGLLGTKNCKNVSDSIFVVK